MPAKINYEYFLISCARLVKKLDIEVNRFYLVEEDISNHKGVLIDPSISPYKIVSLKPDVSNRLASIPKRDYSEDDVQRMLSENCTCLCLIHHNDIAGYIWYSLKRIESRYLSFSLNDNEAYIFGLRTMNAYKRKGVAFYLRNVVNERLHALNRNKLYCIIHYSNKPSLRLNDKCNAKTSSKLYVYISLFNKFKRSIYLKNHHHLV